MQQLGELQKSADSLRQQADTYVIRQYDMLPKSNQPMGMMSGVGQMGYVVIDASGTIRVQRVDIQFGQHAPQILEILRRL